MWPRTRSVSDRVVATGLREAIWSYVRRQWNEAFRVELTSRRSQALLRRSQEQGVDEIAAQVFPLLQRVPDACEDPQTVLFNLTRTVIERNEREPAMTPVSEAYTAEAAQQLIQAKVREFNPESQRILNMHLEDGAGFRDVARKLGMNPDHVLRILTKTYSQLRLQTELLGPAAQESSTTRS